MAVTEYNISSFGALLKAFRKRRHLTQQQLAGHIGVHRSAIIRWEQGDFLPESKALVLELARHLHLDNQESRQLLEASLTALAPHWHVPFQRNPFFTGREEILEALHIRLSTDQTVALTQSYALHGLGGIGKTQLALEYAYRHALEYNAVFWIEAETGETIISSLLQVAELLQLPERQEPDQQRVVEAVQRWLSSHHGWLLIWDNVEDLDLLSRFMPAVRQGAILLTTRRQALGTMAVGMDVVPMEQEEGAMLVLRRAKVLEPEATDEQVQQLVARVPGEYAAARELVTIMGGLPLALDQAGAYIEETGCGLASYLRRYQQQCQHFLTRRGSVRAEHPHSVVATLELACQRVAQQNPAALELLRFCAFLYPDAIPEELLLAGADHVGPILGPVVTDISQFDDALEVLLTFSLVQRQPETHLLSLHRLVQTVLKGSLSRATLLTWMTCVLRTLSALFPSDEKTRADYWPVCERLLPHALVCLTWSEDREGPADLSLMSHVAVYLLQCSRYEEAEALFQRALHLGVHLPGSEQALVVEALSGLAVVHLKLGHNTEAESLFLRAIRLGEQTMGNADPQVVASLSGLASLYKVLGKYEEAEPLYQKAFRIQEQTLDDADPQVATLCWGLAGLYGDQGKYAQAESLYHRALYIRERTLGSEHPQVAAVLNDLGYDYKEQGKYTEAEPLLQRALQIWERALGPEHPRVSFPLQNLGELFLEQGNYAEAEPLFQRELQICEQAGESMADQVAEPLHGLACLCREQGNYMQAESLFQRTLRIREQHRGPHHPETAQTLFDLALLRQRQGQLDEALSFAERALSIRSQSLGKAHPKTVTTQALYEQLLQERPASTEPTIEHIRTILKARGWSVHLKKQRSKLYVYATRKVGRQTQSRYLAPLSNLATCLAAARVLPNAREGGKANGCPTERD